MQKSKSFNSSSLKKERNIIPVLGVGIDSTSKERALSCAWGFLKGRKAKFVVTPNPEIIIASTRDSKLATILNKADFSLPDGIGVVLAMRYLSLKAPKNKALRSIVLAGEGVITGLSLFFNRKWLFEESQVVPGRVLFEDLVAKSAAANKKVYLLGGRDGVADQAAKALSKKYEGLRIRANSGPLLNQEGMPVNKKQEMIEKDILDDIKTYKPEFLFVAFGHPKQEKWIYKKLSNLDVKVAMTVGGALDYVSGKALKAPVFFSSLGSEWLWRLITQPRRIKRIMTAVLVFPWKIYFYRLSSH